MTRNSLHCFLLMTIIISACSKKDNVPSKELQPILSSKNTIDSFYFKKMNNSLIPADIGDIYCDVSDSIITGFIPTIAPDIHLDLLIPSIITQGEKIVWDSTQQKSDSSYMNLQYQKKITIYAEDGSAKEYTIKIGHFTKLPILYINTQNIASITSKDQYIDATYSIDPNTNNIEALAGTLQIRGRGNSTWSLPKKPYRIKLDKKAPILGMPSNKQWALLANYSDKTLLRNYVALNFLSDIFQPVFTPKSKFVEVVLNNEYLGNYLLTQTIQIDENRVNMHEMNDEDITGGYLMEQDQRYNSNFKIYSSTYKRPIYVHDPEQLTTNQANYITQYINSMERAIASNNTTQWAQYLDANSFISWFWIQEIAKNSDAANYSSIWMFKDKDSLLKMGPIWDFDLGFGNYSLNSAMQSPENWYIKNNNAWIKALFNNADFAKKAISSWNNNKITITKITEKLDSLVKVLNQSQLRNFSKWQILNIQVPYSPYVTGSYQGEIEILKDWLSKRIAWIDNHINELTPP